MTTLQPDIQRTKIICTLGPASDTPAVIGQLIDAGMDVARLNFSHGTHETHAGLLENVRAAARERGQHTAVLQDLQGPKMRVGELARGAVELKEGREVVVTTEEALGTAERIPTTYEALARDVSPGDRIFLDDGLVELRVTASDGREARCEVVIGGEIGDHCGINLPGVKVSSPAVTEKDLADLEFGLDHGVEYVALSFVRRAADVEQVKATIRARGAEVGVVAKLEKPEALDELCEIVEASDAIMVARGDLGVEAGPEAVPLMQKQMIRCCREQRVPVITATEMLESMVEKPRPTRAEASDVANAIFDGTDALMLSGETAVGEYPVEAVRMMRRIALAAEQPAGEAEPRSLEGSAGLSFADAVTRAACQASADLNAAAVIACTHSGWTARQASKWRPRAPIIAATPFAGVARRANLYWGVWPLIVPEYRSIEEMIEVVQKRALERRMVKRGDTVLFIAGTPVGRRGTTNMLRLHRIGE